MGITIYYTSNLILSLFNFISIILYDIAFFVLMWHRFNELEIDNKRRANVKRILMVLIIEIIYMVFYYFVLPGLRTISPVSNIDELIVVIYNLFKCSVPGIIWVYIGLQIFRYGSLMESNNSTLIKNAGLIMMINFCINIVYTASYSILTSFTFTLDTQILLLGFISLNGISLIIFILRMLISLIFIVFGVINKVKIFQLIGIIMFIQPITVYVIYIILSPILIYSYLPYLVGYFIFIALAIILSQFLKKRSL